MTPLQNPLTPVVGTWLEKIRRAAEVKDRRFGKDAEEGMRFFNGPYDFLYKRGERRTDRHFKQTFDDEDDGEIPAPKFQMTMNKVAELVQIFGPVLYHKNPQRTVNPREVPLPDGDLMAAFGADPAGAMMLQQQMTVALQQRAMDLARAKLLSQYLNYTPDALDLKTESRNWIDEAIIKGAGVLWTEVWQTPLGQKMVGNFWDSIDNLQIDPDAPSLRAAKWIARKRTEPVWEAERRFGLQPGTIRASAESLNQQAAVETSPDGDYWRKTGVTNDLITYWEIWSKTGLGGRLCGIDQWVRGELEYYGDYCYLAVADGHQWPLNLPREVGDMPLSQARAEIARRVGWATPYWADDEWPCTMLGFHWIPGDPWPLSHLSPGLGELKFLNWGYSLLAGKMRISTRDFIAIMDEVGDDVRQVVLHGADYEMIRLKASQGKSIDQLVSFLQHPGFNKDILTVLEMVAEQFERRVGLNELLYGESQRQLRSAAEAEMKSNQVNVRPEDMANKVEDAMSLAARKEAMACRWHLTGRDVMPVVGTLGSFLWDRFITPSQPAELLYSLEYRIEAGSIRKPNRERDAQNVKDAMQTLMPFYQNLAAQGLVEPFNQLVTIWGQAIDMKVDRLLLQPMPLPPAPAPGGGGQPPA